jgi:hypothetical protein
MTHVHERADAQPSAAGWVPVVEGSPLCYSSTSLAVASLTPALRLLLPIALAILLLINNVLPFISYGARLPCFSFQIPACSPNYFHAFCF